MQCKQKDSTWQSVGDDAAKGRHGGTKFLWSGVSHCLIERLEALSSLSGIDERPVHANTSAIGRCTGTTDAYTALSGVIDSAEHLSAIDKLPLYSFGRVDHGLGSTVVKLGPCQGLTIERF